jgi:hypothetical protein
LFRAEQFDFDPPFAFPPPPEPLFWPFGVVG